MNGNGGRNDPWQAPGMMLHDPLADVDDLTSTADDILEGELLPPEEDIVVEEVAVRQAEPEPVEEAPAVVAEESMVDEPVTEPAVPEPPSLEEVEKAIAMEMAKEQQAVEQAVEQSVPDGNITLEGALTLREMAEVYQQLSDQLDLGVTQFVIDISDLQQVDGAGLQLMAAFAKEISTRGGTLEWKSVTASVQDSAMQIGLAEVIGL